MFKIKLTFLFCFLVSKIFCSWNPCPENEQSYLFEEQIGNWKKADGKCEAAGGTLATVISENCTLRNLNENLTYFIGGKKSSSGNWTWKDGTQMNQTFWDQDEPDNSGGKEDYLHIWYRNDTYLWNDISCDRNIYGGYICQKKSDITESISSGISEQPTMITTTPKDTTIKRIGNDYLLSGNGTY
ncbi:perlucin-like [Saccostrea cucullata]|uniref:perlucin-like n=1 Tax=Saccostrea cuccullata TaxID=36930 RepID=UPI002ED19ACB